MDSLFLELLSTVNNKTFERLKYDSGLIANGSWDRLDERDQEAIRRLADLVVEHTVHELKQEWYDLNAQDSQDDTRAVAIMVGQKNGILKAIARVKAYFGVA